MSTDPYAAPSANLDTEMATVPTSIWNAKGRLSVLSYLAHSFLLLIAFMVIMAIVGAIVGFVGGGFESMAGDLSGGNFSNPGAILGAVIFIPLFLLGMYVGVCMMIKRLHDRNHSGWWSLAIFVVSLIPIIGLIAMIAYLYVFFFPGQKHSNRFGGPRPTRGWEKILGILYILLMIVAIVGGIFGVMSGMGV